MPSSSPFHLAFTVIDIDRTRAFFGELLGCPEGYVSRHRVDFDLFGNHLVAHLRSGVAHAETGSIQTDEQRIPLPHFGVILELEAWHALVDRLRQRGTPFMFEPRIVRPGTPHEQAIFFLTDPSGNTFEFKGLKDASPAQLLARR